MCSVPRCFGYVAGSCARAVLEGRALSCLLSPVFAVMLSSCIIDTVLAAFFGLHVGLPKAAGDSEDLGTICTGTSEHVLTRPSHTNAFKKALT